MRNNCIGCARLLKIIPGNNSKRNYLTGEGSGELLPDNVYFCTSMNGNLYSVDEKFQLENNCTQKTNKFQLV